MTVFGIHCNFSNDLPIRLKTCRSNVSFFFARQNVRAQKIGRVSEVLRAQARPIGIGRTICPGLINAWILFDGVFSLWVSLKMYFQKNMGSGISWSINWWKSKLWVKVFVLSKITDLITSYLCYVMWNLFTVGSLNFPMIVQ